MAKGHEIYIEQHKNNSEKGIFSTNAARINIRYEEKFK